MADKFYGKEKTSYSTEEQGILAKLGADKMARSYYETLWQEFSYAYQTVLYEYAYTRQFNPDLPLEQQVRRMFPENRLSDYKLPMEFAVITRQVALELSNIPRVKWSSSSEDPRKQKGRSLIFQNTYDYVFDSANGDWEQVKTLFAKAIFGTAMEYVYHDYQEYPDYEVSGVSDGEVEWKKITRIINQTKFKNKDIRHVFVDANANDIDEAEHAFVMTNMRPETFKKMFANPKLWDIDGLNPISAAECYVTVGESRKGSLPPVFQVMEYFDVPTNALCITANGRKINKKEMHIPVPSVNGKPMIPVAVYYESKADNEFYGISKCAIIKPFREVKNKLRNAFFDISKKVAFNTLIIDPMSDFDETTYEFGQPFLRANPDEVKPLPVSANLQPIIELDKQTDQDVIVYSGINILNTAGGTSSESATKSAIRQESQVQLVELGLKLNSYHGFARRATLLKQLIRLHYKSARVKKIVEGQSEPIKINTPGIQLKRGFVNKDKISVQKIDGMGQFELKPTDFEDDVEFMMEGGTISATKELVKARQMDAAEFIKSLPPSNPQSPMPYDVNELVKWAIGWGELPPEIAMGTDKPISEKSPEDIMKGMDLLNKPPNPEDFIKQQQDAQAQAAAGGDPNAPAPVAPTPAGGRPTMASQVMPPQR